MKSTNLEIAVNVLNKNINRDIVRGYSLSVESETEKLNKLLKLKDIISNIKFDQDIENMIDGNEITINQLVAGLANNPATKNTAMEISMAVMTGKLESIIDSIRAEM